MFIGRNQKLLLLRYNEYRKYDFMKEHGEILKKNGCVWLLKVGKPLPEKSMDSIMESGGWIVFRGPKARGGKLYIAHCREYFNGLPNEKMKYPQYYEEMIDDEDTWFVDDLHGTWLCIDYLAEKTSEISKHLFLLSNQKSAIDVLNVTRSSVMYVFSDVDVQVGFGKE